MNWSGSERRRFVRVKLPCKIIVYTPSEHIITAQTKDIGAGGVRVIIEESLDIHSMVGLEIYFRDEAILCEGRVVWVVSQDNSEARKKGLFDTGIEFFKIKEEDRCIINNMVESICLKKK